MAYAAVGFNPLQGFGSNYGIGGPSLYGGAPALGTSMMVPGLGVANPMQPGADLASTAAATQELMMEAMMLLLMNLMSNGGGSGNGLGSFAPGSSSMPAIANLGSSFGSDSVASASPTSSSSPASAGATGGGAEASVKMAQQFLGSSSIGVKGKLANFSAAGGTGNNCADFVSAILANTQGFKKVPGDASVATFKQHLVEQGWRKVSKAESKPGDVVIFNGSQHTELVTKAGGKEAIGSNGGATNQQIKTDSLSWGSQEFYTKS